MDVITALGHALWMAFAMFWEILWPLILGFGLSAVVQAVVSKSEMTKLLPNDSPRSLAIACGLGAASSSCSYAAVALARSIFRKGANFTAAMAFQLASTNLVAELTIIIIVLMGWQFAAAEFVGGPLMVVLMALLLKRFVSRELVAQARMQANKGLNGKMEGHAEMDVSVTEGSLRRRHRLHLRGPDRAPHYRYLPQILRLESGGHYRRRFLCRHGSRGAADRVSFRITGADAFSAQRSNCRDVDQLQLHYRVEHYFPGGCRPSSCPVFHTRRAEDAGAHGVNELVRICS